MMLVSLAEQERGQRQPGSTDSILSFLVTWVGSSLLESRYSARKVNPVFSYVVVNKINQCFCLLESECMFREPTQVAMPVR